MDARLRLREKLTYANVTSTLALFIALAGGVALGASAIVDSSKDVAKESIKNSDVKKNSLTSDRLKDGAAVSGQDVVAPGLGGSAIDESSLGKVPQAAVADQAGAADRATSADSAGTLGGLAADQFARSSQITAGGPHPANGLTQTPIVSFPEIGLEIRTDGDADVNAEVRVVNTNPVGGREFIVVYGANHDNASLLSPGENNEYQPGNAIVGGLFQIVSDNQPSGAVLASCVFSAFDPSRPVSCIGIRG